MYQVLFYFNDIMIVVSHFIYLVPVNELVDNHGQKRRLV